jgi:hypothetical protein
MFLILATHLSLFLVFTTLNIKAQTMNFSAFSACVFVSFLKFTCFSALLTPNFCQPA